MLVPDAAASLKHFIHQAVKLVFLLNPKGNAMSRLSVKQVVSKSKRAFKDLSDWQPILTACYSAAMPLRNPFGGTGDGGPRGATSNVNNRNVLYDSTLAFNAQRLANHIKTELMPSEQEWVEILPGAMVPADQKDQAKKDLHIIKQQAFAALQMSNFDTQISIWIHEMVVTGTGCMMKLSGPNGITHWSTVTQAQVGLLENPLGMIDFVSRKYYIPVDDIQKTWKDATIPAELAEQIRENKEDGTENKVYLVDACYWDMDEDKWYYDVVLYPDKGEPVSIVKRDFLTMQWVIGRWSKLAHSPRGRGPVELALPDHLTLNRVKELLLKNASLAVGGVWISKDAKYFNTNSAKIKPGAILPVRSTGGANGASLARLDVGGDLQLAQLVINDLIASIQRIMLNLGLPDDAGPVRSATEVMARLRQLQQDVGTPFTRILYEGVAQILQIVVTDLAKAGVIPIPNASALKFGNGLIKLQFTSALAQSQRMRDVENLIQAMQLTASASPEMAQQTVPLAYKVEDVGYWIGDKLGVDPKLLRDDTERGQMQGMAGQLIGNQVAMNGGPGGGGGGIGPGAQVAPQQMPVAA